MPRGVGTGVSQKRERSGKAPVHLGGGGQSVMEGLVEIRDVCRGDFGSIKGDVIKWHACMKDDLLM